MNWVILSFLVFAFVLAAGCVQQAQPTPAPTATPVPTVFQPSAQATASVQAAMAVPHEGQWGIYSLDLASQQVELVYGSDEIYSSAVRLNPAGDELVFAKKTGVGDESTEIFTIGVDGSGLRQVTSNSFWDLYPAWSPDGTRIAFLSKREKDLDLYGVDATGGSERKLFDSGDNDADVDWAGSKLVFTTGFKVWTVNDEGTGAFQVTNPANAGQWGSANLPIGDYDPRFNADGTRIVFERLEDPNTTHGGYNLFTVNADGSGERRLTSNNYSQGLASWSRDGTKLVYVVAAIGEEGKYDLYVMNADGSGNRDVTPDYFPPEFLCHAPVFSKDGSKIFFIGQWWQ